MQFILAWKLYWPLVKTVLQMVEDMIPDGDGPPITGPQKLDAAIKTMLAFNEEAGKYEPELRKMFSVAKLLYNSFRPQA